MIGLVKFCQTIKLNSKEYLPNLSGHFEIPIGQRVLPEAEFTTRWKAFSNHCNISGLYKVSTIQLLAALVPQETALLPNYPNPFNPEAWIPYQLANDADVTLTVYDMKGTPVRRFDLGYQAAGFYIDRTNAAYWDGRNEHGETVASGVYFYQLDAGDYTALRRMVILK